MNISPTLNPVIVPSHPQVNNNTGTNANPTNTDPNPEIVITEGREHAAPPGLYRFPSQVGINPAASMLSLISQSTANTNDPKHGLLDRTRKNRLNVIHGLQRKRSQKRPNVQAPAPTQAIVNAQLEATTLRSVSDELHSLGRSIARHERLLETENLLAQVRNGEGSSTTQGHADAGAGSVYDIATKNELILTRKAIRNSTFILEGKALAYARNLHVQVVEANDVPGLPAMEPTPFNPTYDIIDSAIASTFQHHQTWSEKLGYVRDISGPAPAPNQFTKSVDASSLAASYDRYASLLTNLENAQEGPLPMETLFGREPGANALALERQTLKHCVLQSLKSLSAEVENRLAIMPENTTGRAELEAAYVELTKGEKLPPFAQTKTNDSQSLPTSEVMPDISGEELLDDIARCVVLVDNLSGSLDRTRALPEDSHSTRSNQGVSSVFHPLAEPSGSSRSRHKLVSAAKAALDSAKLLLEGLAVTYHVQKYTALDGAPPSAPPTFTDIRNALIDAEAKIVGGAYQRLYTDYAEMENDWCNRVMTTADAYTNALQELRIKPALGMADLLAIQYIELSRMAFHAEVAEAKENAANTLTAWKTRRDNAMQNLPAGPQTDIEAEYNRARLAFDAIENAYNHVMAEPIKETIRASRTSSNLIKGVLHEAFGQFAVSFCTFGISRTVGEAFIDQQPSYDPDSVTQNILGKGGAGGVMLGGSHYIARNVVEPAAKLVTGSLFDGRGIKAIPAKTMYPTPSRHMSVDGQVVTLSPAQYDALMEGVTQKRKEWAQAQTPFGFGNPLADWLGIIPFAGANFVAKSLAAKALWQAGLRSGMGGFVMTALHTLAKLKTEIDGMPVHTIEDAKSFDQRLKAVTAGIVKTNPLQTGDVLVNKILAAMEGVALANLVTMYMPAFPKGVSPDVQKGVKSMFATYAMLATWFGNTSHLDETKKAIAGEFIGEGAFPHTRATLHALTHPNAGFITNVRSGTSSDGVIRKLEIGLHQTPRALLQLPPHLIADTLNYGADVITRTGKFVADNAIAIVRPGRTPNNDDIETGTGHIVQPPGEGEDPITNSQALPQAENENQIFVVGGDDESSIDSHDA